VIFKHQNALLGVVIAGLLTAPLLAIPSAAQKKKPGKPAKPAPGKAAPAAGDAKAGKGEFASEGCSGCHKTKDYPTGSAGPELVKASSEGSAKLTAYIKQPKSGSIMPAFKGEPKTLANIVAYLMTQK
jgi:mono/diheme cytochrome c family protein